MAFPSVHAPLQPPAEWQGRFKRSVKDLQRRKVMAMLSIVDSAISNITELIRKKKMYVHVHAEPRGLCGSA